MGVHREPSNFGLYFGFGYGVLVKVFYEQSLGFLA